MERAFQVDLRGVVDLLSRHLYSSPRVYLRELLQNAVDAIAARRLTDPDAPGEVVIEPATDGGALRVHDTGIGLTEEQVHEFLATIGRSSKRDELSLAGGEFFYTQRHEFLGQFGIGLLSGFLVADEIEVHTKAADSPAVRWIGSSDGRYQVTVDESLSDAPGTTVILKPRSGSQELLSPSMVTELARLYGSLLPVRIRVGNEDVSHEPPWLRSYPSPAHRREALASYARETFGFEPFDIVDLDVPEAGLTGVAFVSPTPSNPTMRSTHRVYLKRMLLAEHAEKLLPEWAFFVRCVVDAGDLRPTATRESLYDDALLDHTREALGGRLRSWLIGLAETDHDRLRGFLSVHELGVKALAVHDDDMLRVVDQWLEFQSSDGPATLAQLRKRYGQLRYVASVDEFRRLAPVAGAQGLGLVNAGYVYDAEIMERLPAIDPEIRVDVLDPSDVETALGLIDPETELRLRPFFLRAQAVLDRLDCELVIRDFDPASLPALYLTGRDVFHARETRDTRDQVDDLWGGVLDALGGSGERPRLVLNHRNPLTRRITAIDAPELVELAVQSVYGQALLLGHHPLRPADTAVLNRSFLGLLEWALHPTTEQP